jgi:type IX secretion system PorP/SprF family membrane protein
MTKKIKHIILILAILMLAKAGFTQQFPLYSQYYQNMFILNPAYAGTVSDYAPLRLSVHKQWLGVNESPSTQYISYHQQLQQENIGIGGQLFHDKFGPIETIGANFAYAYHLDLNRELKLSLGLSAQLMHYRLSLEQEDFYGFEPILTSERLQIVIPDAHFGALMYHDNYWVGLSITQLFQSKMKLTGTWEEESNQLVRHYFASAGYNLKFPYNRNFELVPSVLIKTTEVTPIQTDFNIKLVFYGDFWFAFSLRPDDSFVAMMGLTFDKYYFAISHDFTFSDISNVTTGSEELSFGWNIQDARIGQRAFFD